MAKKITVKKPSILEAYKSLRKPMPGPTRVKPGKKGKGVNYTRKARSGKRREW